MGNDGTAALALVSALITNMEARGGDVLRPIEQTMAELFSRPITAEQKASLRIALDTLAGIRDGFQNRQG